MFPNFPWGPNDFIMALKESVAMMKAKVTVKEMV